MLFVVWNIIVFTVLDCDRSIRHFFIGDDDYVGDGSGGVMITLRLRRRLSRNKFWRFVKHGGSHWYKPPSDENAEFVLHSWMFAENEGREKWEQCLSYKFWFHIDCTEHDGGTRFEMFNSLILCKTWVFTVAVTKIPVLWDVTPCRFVCVCLSFGIAHCPCVQGSPWHLYTILRCVVYRIGMCVIWPSETSVDYSKLIGFLKPLEIPRPRSPARCP